MEPSHTITLLDLDVSVAINGGIGFGLLLLVLLGDLRRTTLCVELLGGSRLFLRLGTTMLGCPGFEGRGSRDRIDGQRGVEYLGGSLHLLVLFRLTIEQPNQVLCRCIRLDLRQALRHLRLCLLEEVYPLRQLRHCPLSVSATRATCKEQDTRRYGCND